jgi:hypothetical protein
LALASLRYTKAEIADFRAESNQETFQDDLAAAQKNLLSLSKDKSDEASKKEAEINRTIAMLMQAQAEAEEEGEAGDSHAKKWDYGEETMMSPTNTGKKTWDNAKKRTGSVDMFYMDDEGFATFEDEKEATKHRTWEKAPRNRRGTLRHVRSSTRSFRTEQRGAGDSDDDDDDTTMSGDSERESVGSYESNRSRRSRRGSRTSIQPHSRRGTFTRGDDNDDLDFDINALVSAAKAETVAAILSAEAIVDQKFELEREEREAREGDTGGRDDEEDDALLEAALGAVQSKKKDRGGDGGGRERDTNDEIDDIAAAAFEAAALAEAED